MNSQALDISTLWERIEELSGILQQNRKTAADINLQTAAIQDRINSSNHIYAKPVDNPELLHLQQELAAKNETIEYLQKLVDELSNLVMDYEGAFSGILQKIREFSAAQSAAVISTVESYNAELATERTVSGDLRMANIGLVSQLHKISALLREAYRASTEADSAASREMLDLRAQNASLRAKIAGLESELARKGNGEITAQDKPNGTVNEEDAQGKSEGNEAGQT